MEMNINESLREIERQEESELFDTYRDSAFEYASQGFDEAMVAELLEVDGCPRQASKKIASSAIEGLPQSYELGPPESYSDVKEIVEQTILNTPIEDLEEYFKSASFEYHDTAKRISTARIHPTQIVLGELHKELEPLVTNLILSNKASVDAGNFQKTSSKSQKEKDLFGVWSTYDIEKYQSRFRSEQEIVERTKKLAKKNDMLII